MVRHIRNLNHRCYIDGKSPFYHLFMFVSFYKPHFIYYFHFMSEKKRTSQLQPPREEIQVCCRSVKSTYLMQLRTSLILPTLHQSSTPHTDPAYPALILHAPLLSFGLMISTKLHSGWFRGYTTSQKACIFSIGGWNALGSR